MRVRIIRTRPATGSFRDFVSWMVRGHAPAIPVERREIPYWQERGWSHRGREYRGTYQTPYASFEGRIEEQRFGNSSFYLFAPSREIRSHSHWVCFADCGKDWFLVHMRKRPKDVSSGIITIERLITEAYEK